MVGQVAAAAGAVFVANADHLHLTWVFENGRLLRGRDSPHPKATRPVPFSVYDLHLKTSGFRRGTPIVQSDLSIPDEDGRAYLAQLGVKAVVLVPVMLDEAIAATFHLRFQGDHRPLDDDLQIVQALGDQTALAFRLTRLAAEARAAAVAQQREQEARLRAESIARLGNAGRRALERLANSGDPGAFLGDVLTAAAEQLGAAAGAVWQSDAGGLTQVVAALEDGAILTQESSSFPPIKLSKEALDGLRWRGAEVAMDDSQIIATRADYAPFREQLAREGIVAVLRVPLFLTDEFRGVLVLRFNRPRRLSVDETELAAAFGNQAVLAMELKRLTQSARDQAVSGERSRLARDFHDTLAQGLAAIIFHLETAASVCPSERAQPHIAAAGDIARESLIEARRSIRALRPAGLDSRSLQDALSEVMDRQASICTASFQIRTQGTPRRTPADVESGLLRIVTEAVVNASKHAQARAIDLELTYEAEGLRVVVRDDGIGFDAGAVVSPNFVGLSSMRERADSIGAALTVASEPNGGTEVLVYWAAPSKKMG